LLSDLFQITRGRGMVLFTSYDMLRRATESLQEHAVFPGQILAQGVSGPRERITAEFARDFDSVLMGTHSFWEGVDIAGESLTCLVMARLPFAVFTDPVIAARCEKIEEQGASAFTQYSLPSAVIKFRQGFGRLIRHRQDRGIVIVADRRLVSKSYGSTFRRSIPARTVPCPDRQGMLGSVESFLAEE